MAKLSVIQLTTVPDVEANLRTIEDIISTLDKDPHHLVLLPECCLFFGGRDADQLSLAKLSKQEHNSALIEQLANLARKYHLYLVAGTLPVVTPEGDKFLNRSCVFSPKGELLLHYDKIHLFDVLVEDSEKNYLESKYTQAGTEIKSLELPFAHLGLTVCYDLRFPELFRALAVKGANIITVPAAFTKTTGQAHWQVLLQARAIENQCYIVAAGQQGVHANGRETWGHSMVISPWGEVLACLEVGEGSVTVDLDLTLLDKIRGAMPVNTHNQFTTELIK